MYIDKQLELSDAQAVTADAASSNYIDMQVTGLHAIPDLFVVVQVETTFDSAADNGTLIVKVQTDDDSAFGSAVDIFATGTLAQTDLTAGARIVRFSLTGAALKRYLRVYYDNGTAEFTAGKVDAFLAVDVPFSL